MTKRVDRVRNVFALCALFLAMGTLLAADNAGAAQRTRASSQNFADGGTPTILVLPFQYNTSEQLEAASDFSALLTGELSEKRLNVVPQGAMLQLLQQRNVRSLDTQTVRSLAVAARATHAVYGTVSELGGTISIDARLVAATGSQPAKPLFSEQRLQGTSLQPAASALASRVSGEFVRRDALSDVEVRGTKVLDPDVVLMRIDTQKGDMFDPMAIDRDVKRIWDLGYFSDVQVSVEQRPEGVVLVYTVVEKPRVESVTVEGTSELDEDDVTSVMGTKAGSILNERLLSEDLQKILELYRKKGFYLARVEPRIDSRQGGASAALVLSVNEGKKLYVKDVRIEGVQEMSQSDVKGEMQLKERGMFSWITGTGVLQEELIERDAAAITSFYLNRGFLDVTVGAAKVDYEDDGIVVTFPIHEGPRYKLGTVEFTGDLIDTDERLRSLTAMDELADRGDYFNLSVMQSDAKKLTDFYADYGYAFAEVNPQPRKRAGEQVVDVVYLLDKGSKVYVRRVLVEGNNKTRDNVILREMRVTDAEPFEGSRLRRSTERLNKLGYFEVVEAELVPTANDDEVDLKVKVKERPTGALIGGVGYSTFSNFGVSGTIMERNLWGKGYNVSLQAGFSGRRDAFTFSFTNPRWNDTNLSVGLDLYHWRDDYYDYRKKTTGGLLRMAYPLGEYTSIGWGYRLDHYKIYNVEDDASSLIKKYDTGDRFSSVALARITRDTTDRERPTSGNIDRISVEYGGGILGGDDDFVTVSAEHQTYYELARNHVLHGRVKGAAIFKNGSGEVPVFERFWMGGIDSVRGYSSRDLVPRDPKTNDRIGGTRMAFANLEYIWTVSEEIGVNLVPFFDIGFNIDTNHTYSWSDELVKSVGLELRWRSPLGDLRFAYGFPLDEDRKGNKDPRFEFSMGQFF